MNYQPVVIWVSVLLFLLLALLFWVPAPEAIFMIYAAVPFLVIYQTYAILKGKSSSRYDNEEEWYENP